MRLFFIDIAAGGMPSVILFLEVELCIAKETISFCSGNFLR